MDHKARGVKPRMHKQQPSPAVQLRSPQSAIAQAPGACRYLPFCKQVTFILVLYKKVRTFIFVYNSLFCNCSKEHIKHSIIFFIFS